MKSLYDPTNYLVVVFTGISAAGVALLTLEFKFSEAVPNLEQCQLIEFMLEKGKEIIATTDQVMSDGSLYHPDNSAKLAFQVRSAEDELLEEVNITISKEVPNVEGSQLLHLLAKMGSELGGREPMVL